MWRRSRSTPARRWLIAARSVSKLAYARLIAAALSHLVVGQGDAAGLVTFADTLRHYIPAGGRAHLRRVLVALNALEATGSTAAAPRCDGPPIS